MWIQSVRVHLYAATLFLPGNFSVYAVKILSYEWLLYSFCLCNHPSLAPIIFFNTPYTVNILNWFILTFMKIDLGVICPVNLF